MWPEIERTERAAALLRRGSRQWAARGRWAFGKPHCLVTCPTVALEAWRLVDFADGIWCPAQDGRPMGETSGNLSQKGTLGVSDGFAADDENR